MATSTLIQYLETSQVSGLGVTSSVGPQTMDRSQTETFIAAASITAGDWVQLDTRLAGGQTGPNKALYVIPAVATALGTAGCIGVALATVASGAKVNVVISGYVAKAKVAVGSAGNVTLAVDTTDATGHAADAANVNVCGMSLEAEPGAGLAAGYTSAVVFKKF